MTLSVAIIGSGPAGFYTADAIVKKFEDVRVDVIDRLPTPFGLLRAGVELLKIPMIKKAEDAN